MAPPRSWREPESHYLVALEHPWYRTLVKLQSDISLLTANFWSGEGALNAHLPITTGSISSPMGRGSDSKPVPIELLGQPTYLADSMQFGLEYVCRLTGSGAYYLMPSFRGEEADSTHLCQFFHSEAEIPGGLDEVLAVVERYLRYLAEGLLALNAALIRDTAGSISHIEEMLRGGPFQQISFNEAAALLRNDTRFIQHAGAPDDFRALTRAGERELMALMGPFTWVTRMDHLSVPFYHAFDPENSAHALNADLLLGIGETVGAGMRHATSESLLEALKLHQVRSEDYAWYVTMRERAPLQTSGFGMGVERFLLWLLNHDDIRDMSTLLRFNGVSINP
ncbi:MAG: amino acid--tRNA ligase-related protein [Angustibacter sp.]